MDYETIKKAVVDGAKIPSGSSEEDKLCWAAVKWLFVCFKERHITRETSMAAQHEIAVCHEKLVELHKMYYGFCVQQQENINKADGLLATLSKAASKDDALDIALKLISRMTQESVTESTVRKNLGMKSIYE